MSIDERKAVLIICRWRWSPHNRRLIAINDSCSGITAGGGLRLPFSIIPEIKHRRAEPGGCGASRRAYSDGDFGNEHLWISGQVLLLGADAVSDEALMQDCKNQSWNRVSSERQCFDSFGRNEQSRESQYRRNQLAHSGIMDGKVSRGRASVPLKKTVRTIFIDHSEGENIMCDYSLMTFPNRLATEGESLVTHTFSTGSVGFASPAEIRDGQDALSSQPAGFWAKLRASFTAPPVRPSIPAVCIPPGARLKLVSIPERAQRTLALAAGEEVIFTEITAAWNQFRDALRLKNGREILLQSIGEGLQIQVLSLTLPEHAEARTEEYTYSLVPRR